MEDLDPDQAAEEALAAALLTAALPVVALPAAALPVVDLLVADLRVAVGRATRPADVPLPWEAYEVPLITRRTRQTRPFLHG